MGAARRDAQPGLGPLVQETDVREKRGDSSDPRGQGGGRAGLSEEAASELGREGGAQQAWRPPRGTRSG